MNSLERMRAAIYGSCQHPPVVVPYLQYYFMEVAHQVTPFSQTDVMEGALDVRVEAWQQMHEYFDCDWVRVIWDRPMAGETPLKDPEYAPGEVESAEQLLEQGFFDLAIELTRRFRDEKFVYGRAPIPYAALLGDFSNIADVMMALHLEPDRCKRIMDDSVPQIMEYIRAWKEVGVHGLWLGQWLCSADMISEKDYLEFIFPRDKIIIDAVRDAGIVPIYHFCGDVHPRLKHIAKYEPVVFGVEEPKKGFDIQVGRVREELGPDVCLLGNVDVYDVVEQGTPEVWAAEIKRQIRAAGPERFIVSCGSPITPHTPPEQLRQYIQVAKEVRDSFE